MSSRTSRSGAAVVVRGLAGIALLFAPALATAALLRAQPGPEGAATVSEVRELVEHLHRLALDPKATYQVQEIHLRRDALRIELTHGTLVFFQPVADRVTGAVFVGEGRILVMPVSEGERQRLAKFTGSPILTETFSSAYFRFSDATEAELRAHIEAGRALPARDPELIETWNGVAQSLNPTHSLRLLTDLLSRDPQPYFYAGLTGTRLGLFDALLDDRLEEEGVLAQLRWRNDQPYYDIWYSFPREASSRRTRPPGGQAESYRTETTIQHDHSLEGMTEVRFRAPRAGDRVVLFELSRFLRVEEVTDAAGRSLPFFQNESIGSEQLRTWGSDQVVVVLSAAAEADTLYTLRFRYRGQVISDLGNGVLYVGARGIWYPSLRPARPARFEMEFRYPRVLRLVASGTQVAETEEGAWRSGRWVSEIPIPTAGFNLGAYESHERMHNRILITVHANQQLEPTLARPLTPPPPLRPLPVPEPPRSQPRPGDRRERSLAELLPTLPSPPPRPAALVEEVGAEVARALDFYVSHFGPFPYPRLSVSQIPGRFGEGFPGLLYLSTFTFLGGSEQARLGLTERTREHFSGLVPAHETAHQWWGNRVRAAGYRDQWINEALATYSSLLYLESRPGGKDSTRQWLERYRQDLLAKNPDGEPWEKTGPLALGRRLNSSHSPGAYEHVVYPKGAWVIHMLRHLLADKAFFALLREIITGYAERPLTTADLQTLAEARLPASASPEGTGQLDWFFEQWVNNTGIPRYRLRARTEPRPQGGFRVTGSINQRSVSSLFTMPLPVYARRRGELQLLGRVVVSGAQTTFTFNTRTRPDAVVLDPFGTGLCVIE